MRKKSRYFVIVLLALAVVALCIFALWTDEESPDTTPQGERPGGDGKPSPPPPSKSPPPPPPPSPRPPLPPDDGENAFTPEEQETIDAIQDALDDNDFKRVVAQTKSAAASTNVAVRARAVEALQWFGEEALPELTMFMADEDDDLRKSAIDAWTMGLSQMNSGEEKAETIRLGLSVVTDREQLDMMVAQVDELDDFLKLNVLTQTIEGNNKAAAEVAREWYKFWTDEEYTTVEEAQNWLDKKGAEEANE